MLLMHALFQDSLFACEEDELEREGELEMYYRALTIGWLATYACSSRIYLDNSGSDSRNLIGQLQVS